MIELELFRAGDYPQGVFTDADVKALADAYDPAIHEAPLVVGHKTNEERSKSGEPAHGWFKSLRASGGTLYGVLPDMSEWATKALKSTHKKWSVELYPALKDAGGKQYLKAVALLGAGIPQVKGLRPATFKDETDETIVICQEETMPEPKAVTADDLEKSEGRIMTFIKGLLPKRFSEGEGNDAPSSIEEMVDDMSNAELSDMLDTLSGLPRVQELASEKEAEAEEAHMREQESNPDHKYRIERTKKDIGAWVDKMITDKHLSPAAKDAGIAAFCELLAFADIDSNDDGTLKFSDKGDAMTPLAFFQQIIEKHQIAPSGSAVPPEKGKSEGDAGKGATLGINLDFSERAEGRRKEQLDEDRLSFAEKAAQYAKDNKVSLADAMITLSRQAK